ncbi:MAG: MFS transporter [Thermodesulfobacteriota bacterium]
MEKVFKRISEASQNIFFGWWIVLICFFINAFGIGTFFYGFSTFFNPMVKEFGWSRALMAGVYSLSRLEGGIEGPLAGWLIDRYGARRVMLFGIFLAGSGFILLSFVHSPLSLYLIFGLTLSLGYNLGYVNGTGAAVAKWFIKKRSRAISLLMVGNGIGGAVFVPLIAWLILSVGWRNAAIILGVVTFLFPLPLSLLVKGTPEEVGMKPDGDGDPSSAKTSTSEFHLREGKNPLIQEEEEDFTVKEAVRTRAFWIYSLSMVLRACILSSIVVHQIPHLMDIGISFQSASTVLGMMVLVSVPGRFIFGSLGDRYSKKTLLFFLCLLQAVGILVFIHAKSIFLLYVFVILYGTGYGGAIPLSISFRADLFGRKNYATISGLTMTVTTIGTVAAPILAGYLYDLTKSYSLAFYSLAVLIFLSGVCFLFIPKPVKKKAIVV